MAEKKWRRLPDSFSKEVLLDIRILAGKGANKTEITRTLDISPNALHYYRECSRSYEAGRDDLRQKIRETMIDSCATSPTSQRVLADRLGLFSDEIKLDFEIKDIKSCTLALGIATKAYLGGRISDAQLESVRKSLTSLSQTLIDTDIAFRLAELEKAVKNGTK